MCAHDKSRKADLDQRPASRKAVHIIFFIRSSCTSVSSLAVAVLAIAHSQTPIERASDSMMAEAVPRTAMWLDCDPGHDDCIALILAGAHKDYPQQLAAPIPPLFTYQALIHWTVPRRLQPVNKPAGRQYCSGKPECGEDNPERRRPTPRRRFGPHR